MRYLISNACSPLKLILCGQFFKENHFLHPSRTLDATVLIYVTDGTLHICQDGKNYDVGPNQCITLFAGRNHYGYKECEGNLSYYWIHFSFSAPTELLLDTGALKNRLSQNISVLPKEVDESARTLYILPEYTVITLNKRVEILISQLLDITKRSNFQRSCYSDYALSALILELSSHYYDRYAQNATSLPPIVLKVANWIRSEYIHPITVESVAEKFNYNPRYLSMLFKQYTGVSLLQFINSTRIEMAKYTLLTTKLSVKETAFLSGFREEKYFMKLFKQTEGMTPSEYRNAFFHKKTNNDIVP